MATPTWQPGTLYNPGALVRPRAITAPANTAPTNPDFESGDTGWDKGAGWTITTGSAFTGNWSAIFDGANTDIVNDNHVPVVPGQVINARCACINPPGVALAIRIYWFDASDVFLSYTQGNQSPPTSTWQNSAVTGVAPVGAAFAAIAASCDDQSVSQGGIVDNFTWDYAFAGPPDSFVFRAVQADAGFSGSTEPTWPTVLGNTVVDNGVTWEAVLTSRVVWEATPILVSGSYEPIFPEAIGSIVADGTIVWEAVSRRIEDEKCPNTAVVAIAASKIFAADGDIIAYCATVNPLDWSTPEDAGYLPFGLQTYGSTPCTALGLYRSNLVAFNAEGYQMWQVDEDPVNMALLDASPVDCLYPKTVRPVSNDLVVLSSRGVRNIGIAGASTNLQAGHFGDAIDPLVLQAIRDGEVPHALFWPGAGQYWLIFGAEAFVLTMNGGEKDASWSRYTFPAAIEAWAILGTDLYLRTDTLVWRMDDTICGEDDVAESPGDAEFLAHYTDQLSQSPVGGERTWSDVFSVPAGNNRMLAGHIMIGNYTTSFDYSPTVEIDGVAAAIEYAEAEVSAEIRATSVLFAYALGDSDVPTDHDFDFTITWPAGLRNVGYHVDAFANLNQADADLSNQFVQRLGVATPPSPSVLNPTTAAGAITYVTAVTGSKDPLAFDSGGSLYTLNTTIDNGTRDANSAWSVEEDGVQAVEWDIGVMGSVLMAVVLRAAGGGPAVGTPFSGMVWWPYLDFGRLGVEKQLEGFDLVCTGEVSITFGYNQNNAALATDAYVIEGDTLPGNLVPMPISGPSFQLRLDFSGSQCWEWMASNLYLTDQRRPP